MTKQAVIEGHLINYFFYPGNPDKMPVIFLHGWRSEGAVWYYAVKLLKEQADVGDIYCLDLPGFGASPLKKKSLSLADYCSAVSGFINKIGLKEAILVGHSFGGRITIKLASKKLPEIKKIVLVDSAGLIKSKGRKNLVTFFAKLVKPIFLPKFMKPLRAKIYWKLGAEDYVATPELNQTFVKVIGEDLTSAISEIALPTLIVWGENDIETPLDDAKFMHKNIADSRLKVIKRAGHLSFLDQPKEFVEALKEFIQ